MATHELVGREAQLDAIRAWLGDQSRLPSARVLGGEPGIGKTVLVRATIAEAERLGYDVLVASPVEPESRLAYAALGDLLEGSLDTILPALPEPQRVAVEAALLLRPAHGHRPEALAVATALLNGLRVLSATRPVLIAIDDAQWLDAATTEVTRFALRRLRTERVAIVLSRRSTADERLGLGIAGLPSPDPIDLGPLSIGAIHALVLERAGIVLSRPTLRHLFDMSSGNPFYALELARAFGAGRIRLEAGEALPLDLQTLVDSRITDMPPDTRFALGACAAMSRPTGELLARVLGIDDPDVVLAPATSSGLISVSSGSITFGHPLLASSAYAAIGPGARRELHQRLADCVPDALERARHLALAANGPDERVAAVVEAAAAETFDRAASADAAELAALALRLTPAGEDETARRRIYLEAYYRFESGAAETSSTLLEGLIADMDPGPERARVMAALARVRHFQSDVGGGVEMQRKALAEAGSDAQLQGFLEESIAEGMLLMRSDLDGAWRHARSAATIAEGRGDQAALAEALAAVALTEQAAGHPRTDAMDRALVLEPSTLDLCVMRQPSFALGSILASDDRLDRAREVLLDLRQRADERGNVTSIAPIRNRLSTIHCLLGDYAGAERLAHESHEFALQNGQLPSRASALGRLALVQARRGDAEGARDAAERSLALAGGPEFTPEQPARALARGGEHALWAMGELALSTGDPLEAERHLGALSVTMRDAGVREPGELRFLGTQAEALILLGRVAEADELAVWLETQERRVPRPSVRASAKATRGMVQAAHGDLAAAVDSLEQAAGHARGAPLPWELGRVLLQLGHVQRRGAQKRAARAALEESVAVFDGLGARRWASNARDELGRIGGRAPARGELSDTEQQVARLVTRGLSNKEVAAAMFVTPKAVEANLSRVFAKTGVRSRAELAARVASEAGASKP